MNFTNVVTQRGHRDGFHLTAPLLIWQSTPCWVMMQTPVKTISFVFVADKMSTKCHLLKWMMSGIYFSGRLQ